MQHELMVGVRRLTILLVPHCGLHDGAVVNGHRCQSCGEGRILKNRGGALLGLILMHGLAHHHLGHWKGSPDISQASHHILGFINADKCRHLDAGTPGALLPHA